VEVVDDYHGTPVPDPYRWLEDAGAEETQAWVAAQNAVTEAFLSQVPEREQFRKRLEEIWNYDKITVPRRRGAWTFFTKLEGLQNQPVLYRQQGLDAEAGEPEIVLDPNTLSEDGTVALITYAPGEDGQRLAYSLSNSGSDWQEIHVLDLARKEKFPEVLKWVKFSDIAWTPDGSGFYYSRYPEPGSVPGAPPSTHHRVYWHRLGTPQTEDKLVYARPDDPDLGFNPVVSEDGRYLILHAWRGTATQNRLYYRPLAAGDEADFIALVEEEDARFDFVGNEGDRFYISTDLDAPRGRIMAVDLDHPERDAWQEIVPEGEEVLDQVGLVDEHLVLVSMHHASHRIYLYDLAGAPAGEVELPALGTISALSGRQEDADFFFDFQSYLYPPAVFRYDLPSATLSPYHQPQVDFSPEGFETRQVFYRSADGTQIPMFLTHRTGLELDGNNPALLYGYGGFAVNILPTFAPSWVAWLEAGGVVAVANLRGGNEYGEAWHQAGMLERKQNVFDDFIAAAEWLIDEGFTSRERLGIMGGSNGGLLVAACMVQRPELFGTVICRVPVADMLRYHRFTAGRYWIPEYGNAEENPEHFRFIYAYSPLHNVKEDVAYPPTLIATADTDDRVVPMHARKLAATLQVANAGDHPILLRIETKAGHGFGKPTDKIIAELADVLAFLWQSIGSRQVAGRN
jgi:prolyl oligopeptidase